MVSIIFSLGSLSTGLEDWVFFVVVGAVFQCGMILPGCRFHMQKGTARTCRFLCMFFSSCLIALLGYLAAQG